MGRYYTGAETVWDAKTVDITTLLKKGCLRKDSYYSGQLTWSRNGEVTGSIGLSIDTTVPNPFVELNYTKTDSNNQKKDFCYKVYLYAKESNLGKGFRWYFVCPVSGKNCSILYMAYGSEYLRHRDSYRYRIYYDGQIMSKNSRWFKCFAYENKLEELWTKRKKSHYRGRPTRIIQRIKNLQEKTMDNYNTGFVY